MIDYILFLSDHTMDLAYVIRYDVMFNIDLDTPDLHLDLDSIRHYMNTSCKKLAIN